MSTFSTGSLMSSMRPLIRVILSSSWLDLRETCKSQRTEGKHLTTQWWESLGPKPHAEEKRRVVNESGVNSLHYGHPADSSSIEVNQLQQIKRWLEVTRTSTPTILCCRTQRERGPVGSAVAQGDPDRTMMISDWSTAMTCLAPALAANMARMPVPQPTSSTTCRMGGEGRRRRRNYILEAKKSLPD
ncbi:hypothetical protein EYF80_030821 [Liparis tanakae]|uniref:Uncharacterized protein n=1 Tax=Liparis tanakae TaxID=230148 RepID=A0A4Z2GZ81_9TELE|nr:hypothetical protein EYF80_030821 [Liparis tanakae]